ncbi:MAG: MFS transporter [Acidobacteria bacterium]|nr:MFS transporter [Acidobacteriota bacterium]
MKQERSNAWFALWVLFAINAMNFFDRQILGAVGEAVRKEWGLSDGALGALGTAFTLLYAFVGLPLGRLADRTGRKWILSAGVFVWSLTTVASGLARNFWQLFVLRLGVGVGEASCAPAATSLIGDLVPANRRARALSIFMLGLPVGIALSFAVSGTIARSYGWRPAFYVAGIPGLLCAVAALTLREPKRGATEVHNIGGRKREGSPYRLVLSTPTMRWLIISGALHNFNMYAIGSFITPYLMRYHGSDIRSANFVSMVVYGLSGAPGLIVGGVLADAVMKRRANGRLLVGALAILGSVPFIFFALGRTGGDTVGFMVLMGIGCALMYAGPYGTGLMSDFFTARAAGAAGVTNLTQQTLEPFRAEGLHNAMYIIPILGALLTIVLIAASRTVTKDMEKLQSWMRESSADEPLADVAHIEAAGAGMSK